MVKFRFLWIFWVGFCTLIAILISATPASSIHTSFPDALAQPILMEEVNESLPTTVRDPTRYRAGISRSLHLLSSSTPEHPNTVRILFYGQSITKQEWWLEVVDQIKAQFPYAHLIVENRAIGGFASPLLVHTAEQDLYPFYPDLMIFHVYGDEENYEAIIANTRRRTTAEIALASDHITWLPTESPADDPEQLRVYHWFNQHTQWLETIANRYDCELIDIRTPWEQYLKIHKMLPQELLSDDVHLNTQGNHLMARLISEHLLHPPIPQVEQLDNSVIDYHGSDLKWQNGKLVLEFEGNRVDLIAPVMPIARLSLAAVFMDGKSPSYFPELYAFTRPSNAPGVDWPSLLQIHSGSLLLPEIWTLTIREASPQMNQFQFDLYGSQTGFDGNGNSTDTFISNSGRIRIEPKDWWLEESYQFSQKAVPIGFQIQWQVEPLFTDIYTSSAISAYTGASITTLAQNLSNTKHKLEIVSFRDDPVPIKSIRVYHPLLR